MPLGLISPQSNLILHAMRLIFLNYVGIQFKGTSTLFQGKVNLSQNSMS